MNVEVTSGFIVGWFISRIVVYQITRVVIGGIGITIVGWHVIAITIFVLTGWLQPVIVIAVTVLVRLIVRVIIGVVQHIVSISEYQPGISLLSSGHPMYSVNHLMGHRECCVVPLQYPPCR
jgi:hypothetical protein